MKNQSGNHILLICDDFKIANAVLGAVEAVRSMPPVTWHSSFEVAKLKLRSENRTAPMGTILVTDKTAAQQNANLCVERKIARARSLEGIVCDLSQTFSRTAVAATVILTNQVSRPELRFFWEFGINLVQIEKNLQTLSVNTLNHLLEKLNRSASRFTTTHCVNQPLHSEEMAAKIEGWNSLAESEKKSLEAWLRESLDDECVNNVFHRKNGLQHDSTVNIQQRLIQELKQREQQFHALNLLAALKIRQGSLGDAIQILMRLNAWSPRNPIRHTRLGRLYRQISRLELAEDSFFEALVLDDQRADARLELCQIKMMKNDHRSVQTLLDETNDSALRCRFYNAMGIAKTRESRLNEAIDYYLMAHDATINRDEQSKILMNIGIAYAKAGRPTEARYYAGLASALTPASATAARLNSILSMRKQKIDL